MKKFNIPNFIRIKPKISYEVVYIDEFKDGETLGECRFNPNQIVIKNKQSNTETFKTFLHEVIHAVSVENKVGLTENQTRSLEDGIYRVLRLNGWLK